MYPDYSEGQEALFLIDVSSGEKESLTEWLHLIY